MLDDVKDLSIGNLKVVKAESSLVSVDVRGGFLVPLGYGGVMPLVHFRGEPTLWLSGSPWGEVIWEHLWFNLTRKSVGVGGHS